MFSPLEELSAVDRNYKMCKATGTSCDGQLYKNRTHHHMSPETNVAAARTVTIEQRDSTTNTETVSVSPEKLQLLNGEPKGFTNCCKPPQSELL